MQDRIHNLLKEIERLMFSLDPEAIPAQARLERNLRRYLGTDLHRKFDRDIAAGDFDAARSGLRRLKQTVGRMTPAEKRLTKQLSGDTDSEHYCKVGV